MIRQIGLEPGDKITLTIDATVVELKEGLLSYSYPLASGTPAFADVILGASAVEVDHVAPANWPPRLCDLWRDVEGCLWFVFGGSTNDELLMTCHSDMLAPPAEVLRDHSPLTLVRREGQDEPPATGLAGVRIDSLIQRVVDGELIAVSHPDWNNGNPVHIVSLRLSAGDYVSVVFQQSGTGDRTAAGVPADTLVTPVGGAL